jgi:hypothetical protein
VKILTNTFHYIIIIFVLLTVSILFMFYLQPVAYAEPAVLPEGQITGWGWTDTFGWISLNCVNVYAGENDAQLTGHCASDGNYEDYGVSLNAGTGVISGYAWSDSVGWIDFNPSVGAGSVGSLPTLSSGDDFAHTVQMDTDTGYLSGWAVATFNDTDPNNNAWIRFRAANDCNTLGPDETNYCVRVNDNNYLTGWAWSGGDDGQGWIRFSESFSGGPYVQTKYGDIYSGESITGSRAPEGAYNATYCIVSRESDDTITLSSSKSCLLGDIDIEFPDPLQQFTTSIVDIDLVDLKSNSELSSIEVNATNYSLSAIPLQLDGGVYYFTTADGFSIDNYVIDSALSFQSGGGSSGAGTIVVDGDLYIDQSISYQVGIPGNLNEIASIAWIVLGDVYIDKNVTEVVGTFIVLGDGGADSGKFYTGDDAGDPNPLQLEFGGMIVAKEIVLERTFFEGLAPAEIFEYDGRVLLNTPPGLGNFSGNLPAWSR